MKKYCLLLIVLCSLLTGCSGEDGPQSIDFEGDEAKTVGVGESCMEKNCHRGLECDRDFVCVNTVEDPNMVCPETQKPVCGFRDGRKNGYLNECEAERHGAEVLYEGFCKPDESVSGNCEEKVTSIGNCRVIYTGFEFDGKNCQEVKVGGCDADIPFTSQESCEATCK